MEIKNSICLNMIVKNESHIIEKTLNNLCSYIKFTYWIICDTGSDDNTVAIITNFFSKMDIPGEIFNHKWKDFGYNRTLALDSAFNKTDYLFIFDADDSISGDFRIPKLTKDKYNLFFGNENFRYIRPLIINNRKKWRFKGILHEYLVPLENINSDETIKGDYFIISGKEGNRSKNPDKYSNDAKLLKEKIDLIESSNNNDIEDSDLLARYTFYCANSFKDSNDLQNAILYYKKVFDLETWIQEKYISALNIGDIYHRLSDNENALLYWYKAITYDKERREAVTQIMQYYYKNKNWFALNCLHEQIKNFEIKDVSSKLFLNVSVIHKNHYFNSIACANISEWMSGYYSCKYLLLRDICVEITLSNFKCYAYNIHLDSDHLPFLKKLLSLFKKYYKINKGLIEHLWNITSKHFKNNYNLDNLHQVINNDNLNTTILKSKHKISNKEASNKILIYTGYMESLWNDTTLKTKSLGGSEKAVIYLSRHLPKNYEIYIAGDQIEEIIDNIRYINHNKLQALLDNEKFHTIIVSRFVSFFEKYQNYKCHKLVLYCHDTHFLFYPYKSDVDILTNIIEITDYVLCLTEWHKNILIYHHDILKQSDIKIINNGINLSDFETGDLNNTYKIKNKFIWSSCSARGLHILVDLWPEILKKISGATLDICSYQNFPDNDYDLNIKKKIDTFDSIVHHGKLNTNQLYTLMKKSEYWLYTNTFPETSCITAMEMLMSNVICIYYPNAGLVETIGDYGIQVAHGKEIDGILNLNENENIKNQIRKRGKDYAISCSWQNRANQWSTLLQLQSHSQLNSHLNSQLKNTSLTKKIAIFNSFKFHYEMFGYIIEYCKINNFELTIFTCTEYSLGWMDFYKDKFRNYNYEIKNYSEIEIEISLFDIIFVTTDDDSEFKDKWITSKCISINHMSSIRRKEFKNNLGTRPFLSGIKDYALPCFTIFEVNEKEDEIKKHSDMNICCIGGIGYYNCNIINRLTSSKDINLYFIRRGNDFSNKKMVTNDNIKIIELASLDTYEMLNVIKICDYILTDVTYNTGHINGISMSGSVPLSFSTLTPLIISKCNNELYKFKNAIEFNIDTHEEIFIEKDIININSLAEERQKLISMFYKYNNIILLGNKYSSSDNTQIVSKINTALIVDPRNNIFLPSLINDFKEKLGNNWRIVFYCGKGLKSEMTKRLYNDVEIRELEISNFITTEYSDFMKTSELWENLYGDFVLTFQTDAYILNKPPYTIDYFINMNKSYIGGNMSHGWDELTSENIYPEYRNFNGGLSLRKRLDMITIIKTFTPEKTVENSKNFLTNAEDVYFTIGCYRLNYPIGDNKECQNFAVNTILVDKWFGIHKPSPWILEHLEEKNIYCSESNIFKIKPQIELLN